MDEIKMISTIIRKKIKIYVDITLGDDIKYTAGQRLVSFFGQASIFENTEFITDELEEFFEMLSLSFLIFGEKKKFQNDIYILENLDFENKINDLLQKNTLFLPLMIFFYFTDKKTDFFLLSTFKKRYQLNIYKWIMIVNYLKWKEKKFSCFNNTFYFNSIKKYFNLINFLKIFKNKDFTNLFNITRVNYLKPEEFTFSVLNEGYFSMYLIKDRTFFFKSYKYKLLRNTVHLLKKLTLIPLQFLLNTVATKISFLDEDFEYNSFIENIIHFLSQLYINKRTLFRRLRRKKRFKKKLSRNFIGNKVSYYKIYAYFNNNKKKKRK